MPGILQAINTGLWVAYQKLLFKRNCVYLSLSNLYTLETPQKVIDTKQQEVKQRKEAMLLKLHLYGSRSCLGRFLTYKCIQTWKLHYRSFIDHRHQQSFNLKIKFQLATHKLNFNSYHQFLNHTSFKIVLNL